MENANKTWTHVSEKMPEEKKHRYGNKERMESDRVLAWDSLYGPIVDSTVNGKWVSETKKSLAGQIQHGIVAWMTIPALHESDLFL